MPPLQPGDAAPDFELPAIHREGTVALADYRGRSPVLIALFRGVYCPFCRRAIARLGLAGERLRAEGVETLGIVATPAERARRYFQFRPTRAPLAADPDLVTHRGFRLPRPAPTAELLEALQAFRINPGGELPEPVPLIEAGHALNRVDGFEMTEQDQAEADRQFPLLLGEFLVDRDGVVRWARVECAQDGLAGFGRFPGDEELVAAARALPR